MLAKDTISNTINKFKNRRVSKIEQGWTPDVLQYTNLWGRSRVVKKVMELKTIPESRFSNFRNISD